MDLAIRTTTKYVEDRSWLRDPSKASTDGCTLDVSSFTEADHYPNGYIPSGVTLGKITATGLFGPYDNAAGDGTETAVGILFNSTPVDTSDTTIDVGAPYMNAGQIISTNLPTAGSMTDGGWDAAAAADLPAIVDRA